MRHFDNDNISIMLDKSNLSGKLIDCHTHCGFSLSSLFDDKYPACFDIISLINTLKSINFDYAIVSPFPSVYCGMREIDFYDEITAVKNYIEKIPYLLANQRLILESRRLTDKNLFIFPMFSMNYAIDEQIDFLKEQIKGGNIHGLKYYSETDKNAIKLLLTKGKKFLDIALEHNLPITFHVSQHAMLYNSEISNPHDILIIADEVKNIRLNIAHAAHFDKEILGVLSSCKYDNVYFDVSPFLHLCHIRKVLVTDNALFLDYNQPENVLNYLVNNFKNVMWGSDMPFNFTCNLNVAEHDKRHENYSMRRYMEVLKSLQSEDFINICSTNVINFLFGV